MSSQKKLITLGFLSLLLLIAIILLISSEHKSPIIQKSDSKFENISSNQELIEFDDTFYIPSVGNLILTSLKEVDQSKIQKELKLSRPLLTFDKIRGVNEYQREIITILNNAKFTGDIEKVTNIILEQSIIENFDPFFLLAIAYVGSSFNSKYEEQNRFYGLMRFDIEAGEFLARLIGDLSPSPDDLKNIEINIEKSVQYLSFLRELYYGDMNATAYAYFDSPENFNTAIEAKTKISDLAIYLVNTTFEIYAKWATGEYDLTKPAMPKVKIIPVTKAIKPAPFPEPIKVLEEPKAIAETTPAYFSSDTDRVRHILKKSGLDEAKAERILGYIIRYSDRYRVNPIIITAVAKIESNFNWTFTSADKDKRYGLFALSSKQAEVMAQRARVAWAGAAELRNPDYATRMYCAYVAILSKLFRDNSKNILIALAWDPLLYIKAVKSKQALPPSILVKSQKYWDTFSTWERELKL